MIISFWFRITVVIVLVQWCKTLALVLDDDCKSMINNKPLLAIWCQIEIILIVSSYCRKIMTSYIYVCVHHSVVYILYIHIELFLLERCCWWCRSLCHHCCCAHSASKTVWVNAFAKKVRSEKPDFKIITFVLHRSFLIFCVLSVADYKEVLQHGANLW